MAIQRLSVQIGADVTQAIGGVKKLSASIETLRAKMETRKQLLLTETDITKIAKYNKEIEVLKGRIGDITSIGTSQFGKLGTTSADAADKISRSFTNAFSAVRTAANILPGIGIAGLIGIFSDSISSLVSNLFRLGEATNKAKVSTEALNEAMASDDYIKASTSISELTINIDLAKKGLLDKKDVLKQYNESIGKTTGEVKSLDEAEQQLVKNGPAYLKMLLLQAAAHIALEKAAKKAADAEIEFQDEMSKVNKISSQGAERDKAAGADGLGEFLASGLKNEANAAKKAADKRVDALESVAKKFQEDAAKIAKEFNFNFFKPDPEKDKGSSKEVKVKVPVKIQPIGKIDASLMDNLLKETIAGIKNEGEKSDLQKAIGDRLKKTLEKPIPARVNIAPVMTPETEDAAEKLGTEVGQLIGKGIAPGFAGMGEAIGAAIALGESPIAAAGKSILGTIGDLISQIGKALIEYGVVKEGLDKILIGGIAIPGVAAIVAGVAAVAVGQLLKTSFKPKKFAEGGLAFGPTLGLIGEGQGTTRSNPEVVAPLDKLKKFIGGGQNNFPQYLPAHSISGDTLRLWYARANKKGGRHE